MTFGTKRATCIACDKEQTDLEYVHSSIPQRPSLGTEVHIGFPVCDDHSLADLSLDQYVMDSLLIEIY